MESKFHLKFIHPLHLFGEYFLNLSQFIGPTTSIDPHYILRVVHNPAKPLLRVNNVRLPQTCIAWQTCRVHGRQYPLGSRRGSTVTKEQYY
jgi:hypothetical protein